MKYCNCKLCLNPAKWVLISDIFLTEKRFYVCCFCIDKVQGIVQDIADALNGMSDDEEYSVVVREL